MPESFVYDPAKETLQLAEIIDRDADNLHADIQRNEDMESQLEILAALPDQILKLAEIVANLANAHLKQVQKATPGAFGDAQ